MKRPSYVIALDLGGTKLAGALVSRKGRVEQPFEVATDRAGGRKVVRQVIVAAREAIAASGRRAGAIGISIPGLVRRDGTVWAPNIAHWSKVRVADLVGDATGLPVICESDRNASVVGEAWLGAARGATDAVYLIVGTGIGAGILSDGRLIRGVDELSGCAGWLVADEKGTPKPLERVAAGPAIGAAASAVFGRPMTARDVIVALQSGDWRARQVVVQAAQYLGFAVANIISLFNPQVVVLGGGVGVSSENLARHVRRTALHHAQPLAAQSTLIVRSELGTQAPLLGAARLAWAFLEDSSKWTTSTGSRKSSRPSEPRRAAASLKRRV